MKRTIAAFAAALLLLVSAGCSRSANGDRNLPDRLPSAADRAV